MFKGLKWIAAMTLAVAGFAMAAEVRNGNEITGTAHDFSSKTWAGNQVCLPCHTPHHASTDGVSGRLWNHALTSNSITFVMNANNTTTVPGQTRAMLDRVSQMCMGCHDGVTALDAYGSHSPIAGPAMGNINIGQGGTAGGQVDLSNDHPVGLFAIYDQNKQHSGHYSYKEETVVAAAGLRLQSVPIAYTRKDSTNTEVLNAKVVGCTTCHNPHGGVDYYVPNANGTSTTVAKKYLLRADPRTICTSCHTK